MKDKNIIYNKKKIIICIVLTILVFFCSLFLVWRIITVAKYSNKLLPNSYINEYNIGDYSFDSLDKFIDFLDKIVSDKSIKLEVNGQNISYKYKDIGLKINKEETLKMIKKEQNDISYFERFFRLKKKRQYKYSIKYSDDDIKNFIDKIKLQVDKNKVDGHFVDDGSRVYYEKGVNGYLLNYESAYKTIVEKLKNGSNDKDVIKLDGVVDNASNNDNYAKVDTLVSTFTTKFDPYVYARAQNLHTALGYINGAVIEPGEEFSYYKYAGPYDKAGYVFYYEFVGNGVCQIATTVYNAALLGGLEITKRYPHAAKSVYVAGGLDATVASYSSGWYVDMAFKNTYEYPIYIKAYYNGGNATVEFWSNSDAKKGYEYKTESVQIGYRGYKTFLHVYKDGVEVENRYIATTWYTKD